MNKRKTALKKRGFLLSNRLYWKNFKTLLIVVFWIYIIFEACSISFEGNIFLHRLILQYLLLSRYNAVKPDVDPLIYSLFENIN